MCGFELSYIAPRDLEPGLSLDAEDPAVVLVGVGCASNGALIFVRPEREGREGAQLRPGEEAAAWFDGRGDREDTQRASIAEPCPCSPVVREIGEGGCTLNCKRTPQPVVGPDAGTNQMVVASCTLNVSIDDLVAGKALIVVLIACPRAQGEVLGWIPYPEDVRPTLLAVVVGIDDLNGPSLVPSGLSVTPSPARAER